MRKLLAVILFAAAFLCGCAQNSAGNGRAGGGVPTPEYGGTLKIYSYNSDTLNPLFTQNKANTQMLMLVYDYLIKCDEAMRPVPVLASGFGVSADGLVWTVGVKGGISWHDGSPLTANDVSATLSAVKNSARNSPYKSNLANVSKIEAVGNDVRITLAAPQTNFINLLEIPVVKAADTNTFDGFNPVGTGLYTFAQRTNKIFYLSANNSHHDDDAPYITNIEVHLMPDKSTAVYAFEAKEIDVITSDLQSRGKFSGSAQSKSVAYDSGRLSFLSFNLHHPQLSNNAVRTALACAVNKNRIFEEVLLSQGEIATGFVRSSWWMYDPGTPVYNYNPALAVTALNENGFAPGDIKLAILVNEDNGIRIQIADAISAQLREIGISASVEKLPWDTYLNRIKAGGYDAYVGEISFSGDVNPKYILPDTDEFKPLMDMLQMQTAVEMRNDYYRQLQQKYAAYLPSIPLFFEDETLLYISRIGGDPAPQRNNIFDNIEAWFIESY